MKYSVDERDIAEFTIPHGCNEKSLNKVMYGLIIL